MDAETFIQHAREKNVARMQDTFNSMMLDKIGPMVQDRRDAYIASTFDGKPKGDSPSGDGED